MTYKRIYESSAFHARVLFSASCDHEGCERRYGSGARDLTDTSFRDDLQRMGWQVIDDYDHPDAATLCPEHKRKAGRGMFIVIEGPDGVGKSTQAERLVKTLRDMGGDVVSTCEPTKQRGGLLLRELLNTNDAYDWRRMALLFAADRRQHVAETILPALAASKTVVSDRYDLSTMVYQSAGLLLHARAAPALSDAHAEFYEALAWLASLSDGLPRPTLTVVLNAPPEILDQRLRRRLPRDVFEKNREFLEVACELYTWPGTHRGDCVEFVSSAEDQDETAKRVLSALLRKTKGPAR